MRTIDEAALAMAMDVSNAVSEDDQTARIIKQIKARDLEIINFLAVSFNEKQDILKGDLARACELLNKANLYVDVCDDCTHHDADEAQKEVNALNDAIVEFLKVHEEVK